jgi:transposase
VYVLPGLKARASTPRDGSAVAPVGPRPFLPALNGGVPRAFLMGVGSRLEEWFSRAALLLRRLLFTLSQTMEDVSMPRTVPRRAQKQQGRGLSALRSSSTLQRMNLHAAGIDVGATQHWVAVPDDRDPEPIRQCGACTADLYALAEWLRQCRIETVVMESTGVYWIPLFDVLDERGFEVRLVDPHYVKQVPGRKTDARDCRWLQELHTYGLLQGAFRPPEQICTLRSYLRQRSLLIEMASRAVQHMQKALEQMNLKLTEVVSDITGQTGMRILRAIVAGERDPQVLTQHRDRRCKHDAATLAKALEGHWRAAHLFALQQAMEQYDFTHQQLGACDTQIEACLQGLTSEREPVAVPLEPSRKARQRQGNAPAFDVRTYLYSLTSVDLTRIDGIDALTALKLISEIGVDMTRWPTSKHFASWLGLCPGNKISGGKRLSSRSRPVANRAAAALRLAAQSLSHSHSALGGYYRRMKARLGAPKAITATAHKLARLIYSMLRHGTAYVDAGLHAYEQQYRERVLKNLKRKAQVLGFTLVQHPEASSTPVAVST